MSQAVWSRFAYKSVWTWRGVKPAKFHVLTDDRMPPEIAQALLRGGSEHYPVQQLVVIRSDHFSEEPVQ